MSDGQKDKNGVLTDAAHKQLLTKLIGRISLYYVVVGALTSIALLAIPGIATYLPIGGISDFAHVDVVQTIPTVAVEQTADRLAWIADAAVLFIAMFSSLVLMIPVAWVYKGIHQGHDYDHSIDETSLVMPAVVAGVVTVAQHSLALAFSLAGIVAGVRFRRALSDTFDTLFIFVAIGVGLAAGVAAIEIAVVITVFFNYTTALTCIFGDGLESKYVADKELRKKKRAKKAAKKEKKRARQAVAAIDAASHPSEPRGIAATNREAAKSEE